MEGKHLKNHKRCLSHLAKNSESIRQEVGAMQRQLGSFDKKKRKRNRLMLFIKNMLQINCSYP